MHLTSVRQRIARNPHGKKTRLPGELLRLVQRSTAQALRRIDSTLAKKIPKAMIGRVLKADEAAALLDRLS